MPGVWIADPIHITVSRNMYLGSSRKETALFYSTKVIADDPLDSAKMEMCGLSCKLTNKFDHMRDIGSSNCQVNRTPNKPPINGQIR